MSEKNKAQGMYPTPTVLAQTMVEELFKTYRSPPGALVEPSAGFGVFIIESWNYWLNTRKISRSVFRTLVANTWAFENDKDTCDVLRKNLKNWLSENGIEGSPRIIFENFLLNYAQHLRDLPNDSVILGNPPWDEFTNRKHDATGNSLVRKIREEREREKDIFSPLGIKNLYQAFMRCLLNLAPSKLTISFVLPRQILGDMASKGLRQELMATGNLEITVYKNKDEPQYFFEAVDSNFEIAIIKYRRNEQLRMIGSGSAWIRRGFESSLLNVSPSGEDLTIPCPPSSELATTLKKLLKESHLGSWSDEWGVSISRGKITSESPAYSKSINGRTIKAYQVDDSATDSRLVLNKILPNSKRKLKAAILSSKLPVSDSMVMIDSKNKEIFPYLVLMINSRAVELALRSLTSNMNLNNFRLLSLPIPEPNSFLLKLAKTLFNKCLSKGTDWEEASDILTKGIFALSGRDQGVLVKMFPNRVTTGEASEDLVA